MIEETLPPEEGKLIGKITHYFGNIGVAVIELSDILKVGDTIRIVGGETDLTNRWNQWKLSTKRLIRLSPATQLVLK